MDDCAIQVRQPVTLNATAACAGWFDTTFVTGVASVVGMFGLCASVRERGATPSSTSPDLQGAT